MASRSASAATVGVAVVEQPGQLGGHQGHRGEPGGPGAGAEFAGGGGEFVGGEGARCQHHGIGAGQDGPRDHRQARDVLGADGEQPLGALLRGADPGGGGAGGGTQPGTGEHRLLRGAGGAGGTHHSDRIRVPAPCGVTRLGPEEHPACGVGVVEGELHRIAVAVERRPQGRVLCGVLLTHQK